VIDIDAYIRRLKAQPDLAEALAPLFEHIEHQARRIHALEIQVADLTARLAQNSTNSHRPPSSDGYAKAPAIPRPKGGRRGGKPGHPGRALMQVARPDVFDHARPDTCSGCGASLAEVAPVRTHRRQVFDLPEPRLVVREYQRDRCCCPGGCRR
jgi:transposase